LGRGVVAVQGGVACTIAGHAGVNGNTSLTFQLRGGIRVGDTIAVISDSSLVATGFYSVTAADAAGFFAFVVPGEFTPPTEFQLVISRFITRTAYNDRGLVASTTNLNGDMTTFAYD